MQEFRGVFPYLVSPIAPDGSVLEAELRRLVDHLIASGVHGLTPLGSTGEFAYLDAAQRRRIVEIVVSQTAGRVPVVAGVAATTIADAERQARDYAAMGADGVIRTPMTERYFQDADVARKIQELHAMGRSGETQEVANAMMFLASEESSFTTGAVLTVDGGWTLGKKMT